MLLRMQVHDFRCHADAQCSSVTDIKLDAPEGVVQFESVCPPAFTNKSTMVYVGYGASREAFEVALRGKVGAQEVSRRVQLGGGADGGERVGTAVHALAAQRRIVELEVSNLNG